MARAKLYADRVNVIKMVKVNGKWPFAPVVERKGRIVRDHVWIAGRDEHHPEGRYYLEWYQEGKRRRQPITGFDRVLDAARAKSLELNALKAGILIAPDKASIPGHARLTIGAAIDEYLEYVRTQRSLRTYRTYRPTLNSLLRNSYAKIYVDEVSREDILKFMSDCFNLGLGARTVYDKLVVVLQLFKWNGRTGLIETNDWPASGTKRRSSSRYTSAFISCGGAVHVHFCTGKMLPSTNFTLMASSPFSASTRSTLSK
jgi:integrase/recombinase XerD